MGITERLDEADIELACDQGRQACEIEEGEKANARFNAWARTASGLLVPR